MKKQALDQASIAFNKGLELYHTSPLFSHIHLTILRNKTSSCPTSGYAVALSNGSIHVNPTIRLNPEEWFYVLAHNTLHFCFGHFQSGNFMIHPQQWNIACDAIVAKFLAELKVGQIPDKSRGDINLVQGNEQDIFERLLIQSPSKEFLAFGTSGTQDMIQTQYTSRHDYPSDFTKGIRQSVHETLQELGTGAGFNTTTSKAQEAKAWFLNSFPLLAGLSANFKIIEDAAICERLDIQLAAVSAEDREIYINPRIQLSFEALKFIMAHEMLHVGLCHHSRCGLRDPFLWNVAGDYVINGWLIEMGIGVPPSFGLLHDPLLKGFSTEKVYERISKDLRLQRRLLTFRGNKGDILERTPGWWTNLTSLEEFYRAALTEGLRQHHINQRGFLPAGLEEEIQALHQPSIPWDVELANWFQSYFPPEEQPRSYARLSRRQASSPTIARPGKQPREERLGKTFGVILDTSASMDKKLLALGLGAIASYSEAHDVEHVRVIFCDALPYDEGYISPLTLSQAIKVRGRGGTTLQPAVTYLENCQDFPTTAPILIITDGWCDRLHIARNHAYLMPPGAGLDYQPDGPIFKLDFSR